MNNSLRVLSYPILALLLVACSPPQESSQADSGADKPTPTVKPARPGDWKGDAGDWKGDAGDWKGDAGDSAAIDADAGDAAADDGSAAIDADAGDAAADDGSVGARGFKTVPRAYPTEQGDWVADPSDPFTLYALGERTMRSKDGGRTWKELDWPAHSQWLAFAQKPVPAMYLRVAPEKLLKSLDGGDSWTDLNAGPLPQSLWLVDQEEGPVLLAFVNRTPGSGRRTLVRSTDEGSSWIDSQFSPGEPWIYNDFVLVSNGLNPVVYTAGGPGEGGLFVSTDGGSTFTLKKGLSGLWVDCQGRLYAYASEGGILTLNRSGDSGTSWQAITEDIPRILVDDANVVQGSPATCGDSVYAVEGQPYSDPASYHALWHLDNGRVTRKDLPPASPAMGFGQPKVTHLGGDRLLAFSSIGTRHLSDDAGSTWWQGGVNLSRGQLVVDAQNEGSLLVLAGASIYRSMDDGWTWEGEPYAGANHLETLYIDAYDANLMYALGEVYGQSPYLGRTSLISKDGGRSFQHWPVPNASAAETPVTIATPSPGTVAVVTDRGVYSTTNGGGHFTSLLTVSESQIIQSAGIGNSTPSSIYAHVDDYDPDEKRMLVSSTDGGVTWVWTLAPEDYFPNFEVHPSEPKIAIAYGDQYGDYDAYRNDAYRTLDGGHHWEHIARGGKSSWRRMRFDPRPPHVLYALDATHLFTSEDHGTTWKPVSPAPPGLLDFHLDPKPSGALYALTEGGLLYKMTE
jgi:hypothetical protein